MSMDTERVVLIIAKKDAEIARLTEELELKADLIKHHQDWQRKLADDLTKLEGLVDEFIKWSEIDVEAPEYDDDIKREALHFSTVRAYNNLKAEREGKKEGRPEAAPEEQQSPST